MTRRCQRRDHGHGGISRHSGARNSGGVGLGSVVKQGACHDRRRQPLLAHGTHPSGCRPLPPSTTAISARRWTRRWTRGGPISRRLPKTPSRRPSPTRSRRWNWPMRRSTGWRACSSTSPGRTRTPRGRHCSGSSRRSFPPIPRRSRTTRALRAGRGPVGPARALGLTDEQMRVLYLTHRSFVRSGAALDGDARDRLTEVKGRLAVLGTSVHAEPAGR
jgi:hypothetical protein